jgi:hypothetical protein
MRALLFAAVLSACGPLTFTTRLSGMATIPAGDTTMMLAALPLIGTLSDLDFDKNADFRMEGATRADVLLARVESAQVKLVSPMGGDFAFLDNLALVARSGDSETLFAQSLGIATRTPVPSGTLELELVSPEITAQVASAPMSFVMRGKGRQPASDTRLQIDLSVHVEAKRK